MEENMSDVVPCSALAAESILRVGTAGALWGICVGPYDARKQGIKGFPRAVFVAKKVGKYGVQCGLVAGIFSATHCGIQKYRRRNDWVNGSIAGALAGAAIAARTRSWTQIAGIAGLVSACCAAADYSRTN